MSDSSTTPRERRSSGHAVARASRGPEPLAWVKSAVVALAAHALLLWNLPTSIPKQTPLADADTVWEVEAWQSHVLLEPASVLPAAVSGCLPKSSAAPPPPKRQSRAALRTAPHAGVAGTCNNAELSASAPTQATELIRDGTPARRDGSALPGANLDRSELAGEPVAAVSGARAAHAPAPIRVAHIELPSPPLPELVRGARLLVRPNACAGYFPGSAPDNFGEVQLSVEVDAQGHAHPRAVLLESPRGQGFEGAAIACASRLQFAPALDAHGHAVSARTRLALRFKRN